MADTDNIAKVQTSLLQALEALGAVLNTVDKSYPAERALKASISSVRDKKDFTAKIGPVIKPLVTVLEKQSHLLTSNNRLLGRLLTGNNVSQKIAKDKEEVEKKRLEKIAKMQELAEEKKRFAIKKQGIILDAFFGMNTKLMKSQLKELTRIGIDKVKTGSLLKALAFFGIVGIGTLIRAFVSDSSDSGIMKVVGRTSLGIMSKIFSVLQGRLKGLLTVKNMQIAEKLFVASAGKIIGGFGYELAKVILWPLAGVKSLPVMIARKLSGIKMFAGLIAKIAPFASKLKWIPGLGTILGIGFGINRIRKGDWLGGLLEIGGGIASIWPGPGTAISIGIDLLLAASDIASGGPKKGGLTTSIGMLRNWFAKSPMGKKVGLAVKSIPGLATMYYLGSGIERMSKGKWKEGIIDITSGAFGIVPGLGPLVETGLNFIFNSTPEKRKQSVGSLKTGFKSLLNSAFIKRVINVMRFVPPFSIFVNLGMGIKKFMGGDWAGGALDVISGIAGFIPGVGPVAALGIRLLTAYAEKKVGGEKKGLTSAIGSLASKIASSPFFKRLLEFYPIKQLIGLGSGIKSIFSGNIIEGLKIFGSSYISLIPGVSHISSAFGWLISKGKSLGTKAIDAIKASNADSFIKRVFEASPFLRNTLQFFNSLRYMLKLDFKRGISGVILAASSLGLPGMLLSSLNFANSFLNSKETKKSTFSPERIDMNKVFEKIGGFIDEIPLIKSLKAFGGGLKKLFTGGNIVEAFSEMADFLPSPMKFLLNKTIFKATIPKQLPETSKAELETSNANNTKKSTIQAANEIRAEKEKSEMTELMKQMVAEIKNTNTGINNIELPAPIKVTTIIPAAPIPNVASPLNTVTYIR